MLATVKLPAEKAPLEKQLAALHEALDAGDLDWNDDAINHQPLWQQVSDRLQALGVLLERVMGRVSDKRVSEALTRAIQDQADNSLGETVAESIIDAGAPGAALQLIARWTKESDVDRWELGARATLLTHSPADAYDVIAPALDDAERARYAIDALAKHKGDIDPRFFTAAAKYLQADGEDSGNVYWAHIAQPEAKQAITDELERIAKKGIKTGYFYSTLDNVLQPEMAPLLVDVIMSAVKHADWRLTQPLDLLVRIADAATVDALRELAATTKGKAKSALAATLAELATKFPAAKATGKPVKVSSPFAQRLVDAGVTAERANTISKIARSRIEMTPKKQSKAVVGATRFGGSPDLPPKTAWPHVTVTEKDLLLSVAEYPKGTFPPPDKKGRYEVPLAFVAQLDLEELAKHDTAQLLPKKGMLYFFARQEIDLGEKRDLRVIGSHVLYAKTKAKLAKVEPPATLPKRERYGAASVTAKAALPVPPTSVEPMRKLGLVDSEHDALQRASKAEETPTHTCLGWADATYFLGIPETREQLLLRVGSDAISGFEWGDAAPIFFVIATAALGKQDFSKAYCLMDE